MQYIITNFAYGFGPFLRTTELAIAVSNLIAQKSGEQVGIIVPWVYGEKQKAIMLEQFGQLIAKQPDFLLLDKTLGRHMDSVFYGKKSFRQFLQYLLSDGQKVRKNIWHYLDGQLQTETFAGKQVRVDRTQIILEINRNPRIDFNFERCYYTGFAYTSEILSQALAEKVCEVGSSIIEKIIPWFIEIEKKQKLHFIAEPATFFYLGKDKPKLYDTEVRTPPNMALPKKVKADIEKGIYVTVTGIPGLDKLFDQAKVIGLKIYTNQPEVIKGSIKMSPAILGNENILLHFARSGWGSIWLSQFTGTPFVAPAFQSDDDPEIYFNNVCLEKTGLGKIYQGQSLKDLLEFKEQYQTSVKKINQYLLDWYGTLDGISYTAEKIVNHYLTLCQK